MEWHGPQLLTIGHLKASWSLLFFRSMYRVSEWGRVTWNSLNSPSTHAQGTSPWLSQWRKSPASLNRRGPPFPSGRLHALPTPRRLHAVRLFWGEDGNATKPATHDFEANAIEVRIFPWNFSHQPCREVYEPRTLSMQHSLPVVSDLSFLRKIGHWSLRFC